MILLIGALTIGLILSLLALGVFISFRIFDFPDITADGSITFGAALAAVSLVNGVQALTLLMATWLEPRLLLLDEHTAALNPKSADQVIQLTEDIVARGRLTTLMVTHSMHQAANLGDRLIMAHRGQIIYDWSGPAKRRLRAEDLLARFEEVRRGDRLDKSAAEMLRRAYI
jgi:ABC-type sugar transport system ATPase subunit